MIPAFFFQILSPAVKHQIDFLFPARAVRVKPYAVSAGGKDHKCTDSVVNQFSHLKHLQEVDDTCTSIHLFTLIESGSFCASRAQMKHFWINMGGNYLQKCRFFGVCRLGSAHTSSVS